MGTDYDSWFFSQVEGDCDEDSEEEDYDEEDSGDDYQLHLAERQYENWLESLKDRNSERY